MNTNKSAKKIKEMHMKKRGMHFIPYDYESAINEDIEKRNEYFVEYMLRTKYRCVYACKEIRAGQQLEIEIFPEFRKREDMPEELREKHREAQRNLNNKNAVKECQRLILENFTNDDIWLTLTYEDGQEPGDWQAAIKNMSNYIRRINYQRKKRELPKARYLYITEHDPDASIRWHHHLVMDGLLDRDICEKAWKKSRRVQSRRLEEDQYGLVGMANYITKDKHRAKNEKRWNCSTGLRQPRIKKVHSKRKGGVGRYVPISKYIDTFVRNKAELEAEVSAWHPSYRFLESQIYYNSVNGMFYIKARLRKYSNHGREKPPNAKC